MNYEETTNLLTICASFDARTIGTADVMAWQSVLADLAFADAEIAVKAYYSKETDFIKPAHVRAGVRQLRRDRVDTADASFIYNGDPDNITEYRRQLRAHRRVIGDGTPEAPEPQHPELPQRFNPAQLAPVFQSVPVPTRTLLPGTKVKPSPRVAALVRAAFEKSAGSGSEPLEGELLPAERAS